jgi:aspartyl-tRNA(Asn)/glutamyl-tRNA(Gln) amidotransferase subunit C
MSISKEEIKKIAQLSRISLSDAEENRYAETISAVLDYMQILNEVDTREVEATSQVTGLEDVVREDVAIMSPYKNELLKQMPKLEDDELVVPGVFE